MATIDLGVIKPVFKGAYNNSTAYILDNIVTSGGSSYICILASTGNAVSNGTYWSSLAAGGDIATTFTTQGDIMYRNASGQARLAAGTSGQFLKTLGSGANPAWATVDLTALLPKAGGAMTGAITTNSTFDGRDVGTDGTKLDGIEAAADVTDTANVVSALTAGTGITISGGGVIAAGAIALSTVQTAANQSAQLALTTQAGDIVVRSDENKTYCHNGGTADSMADFTLLATPTDVVLSVAGNVGVVTNAHIATAVEAASDSNTFTDADHTKLNAIEASATADQTAAQIKTHLEDGIDSVHYVDGSIDTVHIGDDQVTSAKLAAGSCDGTALGNDSVDSVHIVADSIDAEHYAPGSVNEAALADNAVTAAKIPDNALNSQHYAAGSIDLEHMSANSIDSDQYVDGSIDKVHLSDNCVDSEELVNGSVDASHLATNAVTTGKIAADAITSAKIADDAVDSEHLAAGCINVASFIADDTIQPEHMAANSINSDQYVDGSIDATHLSASLGDLRRGVTHIGRDSNDFINLDTTIIGFHLDGAEDMRLENDGDLHVEGDVIAYSTTISDATLKYNINPVEFALDKIKQLKGVTFNYLKGDKASAGLLAQDVEKVMPSAVTERKLPLHAGDDKAYKTLHYDSMTAILVEAIKELTAKVEKLEKK